MGVDKYADHLPHYRQSRRFRRRDRVDLGRQTINAWNHATAGHLMPIGLAIRREVIASDKLQADETPLEYLNPGHGSTSRGYLWAYRAPDRGGCFLDWQLGRGHECLLEALGYDEVSGTITYQGTIQCDGYSAYQTLVARVEGLRLAGCLAHIRRKFVEAMPQSPETVLPVLLLIQRIYFVEKQLGLSQAPPACRELVRRARSRPLAEELHKLLIDHRRLHLPHGAVGEAVTYALNQWEKFLVCLEDGALELDNNLVENQIRPAKLGELAGLHVIFHCRDQGDVQFRQQFDRLHVAVALVGLQVGDVLHPALDSLRNELGLLLGGFEGAEGLAQPLAVAVVGDEKADPRCPRPAGRRAPRRSRISSPRPACPCLFWQSAGSPFWIAEHPRPAELSPICHHPRP